MRVDLSVICCAIVKMCWLSRYEVLVESLCKLHKYLAFTHCDSTCATLWLNLPYTKC